MNFQQFYSRFKSKKSASSARTLVIQAASHQEWARSLEPAKLSSEFLSLKSVPDKLRTAKGFALVREAAFRTIGLSHFDVQLQGGAVLLECKLAEMRTGEGKTLTITAPAAVLALAGKGVHVVTSNDYLARRDAELMRPVYEALGLSVASIFSEQSLADKKVAYSCDIVYGVGSEFGFDYLKDHLIRSADSRVQRGLYAAIVDEIDSVLIDEARVPLIISGSAADKTDLVQALNACVKKLESGVHYSVSLKDRTAELNEKGYVTVEAYLVKSSELTEGKQLYAPSHLAWARQLHSTVNAYALFKRDRDYVVSGGELVLVDVGTGRKMPGRRFDDGLHEALEAKEGLGILQGTVVKATITYQNYFSKYEKLSGLTGTAMTDAEEFMELYQLETVQIPTNKPLLRKLNEDLVYLTMADKFQAVVIKVSELHKEQQPVLVGCASIRDAEVLDRLLTHAAIPHKTLTAKHIEDEAHIIANAGKLGAVTIATNMAGRGTDILLGGERPAPSAPDADHRRWASERDRVIASGGLIVLGTERNGLRRVDNQLAGRSGRQGDPGEVQFLLSLEDELLKIFGQNKHLSMLQKSLQAPGAALRGATVSRLVESSQKSFEGQGFSARKNLMKYDSALADQRNAVFELRNALIDGGALAYAGEMASQGLAYWLATNLPTDSLPEAWDLGSLKKDLISHFGLDVPLIGWVNKEELSVGDIRARLEQLAATRQESLNLNEEAAKQVVFDILDELWEEHLAALAELRENVSLKGFTGLNATFQFHNDAFELFKSFQLEFNHALARLFFKAGEVASRQEKIEDQSQVKAANVKVALAIDKHWVSRNQRCPCDSGLRFKACHGKL